MGFLKAFEFGFAFALGFELALGLCIALKHIRKRRKK